MLLTYFHLLVISKPDLRISQVKWSEVDGNEKQNHLKVSNFAFPYHNFITKSFCGEVTRFCHLSVSVQAINKGKMIKLLDIKQHFLIMHNEKENLNFICHKIRKQKAVSSGRVKRVPFCLLRQQMQKVGDD